MEIFNLKSFFIIFRELVEGGDSPTSWVTDGGREHSLAGTLEKVNAREASEPVNQHDVTIASHTEHLRWAMEFGITMMQGKKPTEGWEASWSVKEVNEEEWNTLRAKLQDAYRRFSDVLENTKDWPAPDALTGLMAVLPHTAYHLGAIRQMVIRL